MCPRQRLLVDQLEIQSYARQITCCCDTHDRRVFNIKVDENSPVSKSGFIDYINYSLFESKNENLFLLIFKSEVDKIVVTKMKQTGRFHPY